jgi:pimeloyl-ACP methyl ester carboxylesterase
MQQNIKYFVMRNDDYKKQYVVVVGNLWTDRVKRSYEDEQPFDWREHIRLDATVDSIYMHIEPELKKEYTVTVAGHSAGAAIGAQFGLLLHQKQMKVAKIVAFGLPNIMTEKVH